MTVLADNTIQSSPTSGSSQTTNTSGITTASGAQTASKSSSDGFNLVKGIDDDRVEILKGTDGADLFLRSSSKTGAIGDKLAPDIVVDFDPNKDFLRFTDPTITHLGFSEVYQPSAGRYVTNVWGFTADGTPLASFTVMAQRNEVEGRIQNSAGASITKVLYPTNITETDGDTSTIYNGDPNLQGKSGNDTLTGTSTWDVLRGKAGNDTLLSGAGVDGLLGGAGDDTLDGGSGNDVYVGYTGKDTFLIGANSGEDFIYDFNKSEGDIIKITDTRVTKVTVDETKTASGQYVTVVSGLDAQGTVLTKTFVNTSKDSLMGGIQDSTGKVIFTGGTTPPVSGDFNYIQGVNDDKVEILKGTAGADIFLKSTSQNNSGGPIVDIITDFDAGKDYLRFTDPAVTKFVYSETYQPSAGRYVTTITGVGADNTILANFTVMAPFNEVKDRLQKSDGTPLVTLAWPSDNVKETDGDTTVVYGGDLTLGLGTSGNDTLMGGSSWDALRGKGGDDTLIGGGFPDGLMGGAGNDTLDGGSGNDSYVGGTGKDTFIIGANPGEDFILDFNKSEGDIIKITDTRVTKVTVDETKTASGQYVTVVSGLDAQGTVLTKTFVNTSKDSLMGGIQDSAGKVLFSGSTTPQTGTLFGTDIAETINGTENKDTIDGKGGNDLIYGKGGADTFLEGKTSGVDTIYKFSKTEGDVIKYTDKDIVGAAVSEVTQPDGQKFSKVDGLDAAGKILVSTLVEAPVDDVKSQIRN
ncbi:MAG: calcium-binding protein, partial [Holosporales bacterium]